MNSTILGSSLTPSKSKSGLEQIQRVVFIDRIRIKEFFSDYDKLRTGTVTKGQFLSALNTAGLHARIQPCGPHVLSEVADLYLTTRGNPAVDVIDYRRFCADVNEVFTIPGLEKMPTLEIAPEPTHLLDRTRYDVCSKVLDDEKEARLADLIEELRTQARTQRIQVKPFFDDACNDKNSPCLVGHVTWQQFKQVLETKLHFKMWEEDKELLVEKYLDDFYGDMVNYVAFAREVDPPEGSIKPFTVTERM